MDNQYFGEGLTRNPIKDEWLVLTWREGVVFHLDVSTLEELGQSRLFDGANSGWGLTNSTEHLYASDGSSTIFVVDPNTWETLKRLEVSRNGIPVRNLNELELCPLDGKIYANIW